MLRWLRLLPLVLFFMADSGGDSGGDGGGNGDAGSTDADSGGKQEDPSQGDDGKPFATFPDADSFTSRIDREARTRLTKMATDLGFDSVEALQTAAKAQADAAEAEKTESQKEKERADKAEADSKTALARANERVIQAEARAVAAELGVKSERVSYALKLADLSEVEVSDEGEPDAKAIKAAMETVLKDLPELKSDGAAARGGGEFNGGGGDGGSKDLRSALAEKLGAGS